MGALGRGPNPQPLPGRLCVGLAMALQPLKQALHSGAQGSTVQSRETPDYGIKHDSKTVLLVPLSFPT